ncbi:MAG: class I SAM-dependent methyltransferase [Elusimicrobiota bacterium]
MISKIYSKIIKLFRPVGKKKAPSAGPLSEKVRSFTLKVLKGRKGKFLDVGCGEGLLLEKVLEQNSNLEIFGIDMNSEQIKRCRKRINTEDYEVNLLTGDAGNLPFKDNFFDIIGAVNIFYNLPVTKMESILEEIYRVLKPGGYLIADFRNKTNPVLRLRYLMAPLYDPDFRKGGKILKTYSKKEVERITQKAGFCIQDIYKTGRFITSDRVVVLKKD